MKEDDKKDNLLNIEGENKEKENSDEENEKMESENKINDLELLKVKIEDKDKDKDEDEDNFIPTSKIKQNFTPFKDDPFLDSNFISKFFMYWAYKVLRISKKTKLRKEYLGKLSKEHDSTYFYDRINGIWDNKGYKNISKHALLLCILRSNLPKILFVFCLSISTAAADYFAVIFIKFFIDYFDKDSDKSSFIYKLSLWQLGLCFITLQGISSFLEIHTLMHMNIVGNRAGF